MVILTLNCGSSSAKYQVYDWDQKDVLCVGVVERIGLEYSTIEQNSLGKETYKERFVSPTHKEAIEVWLYQIAVRDWSCWPPRTPWRRAFQEVDTRNRRSCQGAQGAHSAWTASYASKHHGYRSCKEAHAGCSPCNRNGYSIPPDNA